MGLRVVCVKTESASDTDVGVARFQYTQKVVADAAGMASTCTHTIVVGSSMGPSTHIGSVVAASDATARRSAPFDRIRPAAISVAVSIVTAI